MFQCPMSTSPKESPNGETTLATTTKFQAERLGALFQEPFYLFVAMPRLCALSKREQRGEETERERERDWERPRERREKERDQKKHVEKTVRGTSRRATGGQRRDAFQLLGHVPDAPTRRGVAAWHGRVTARTWFNRGSDWLFLEPTAFTDAPTDPRTAILMPWPLLSFGGREPPPWSSLDQGWISPVRRPDTVPSIPLVNCSLWRTARVFHSRLDASGSLFAPFVGPPSARGGFVSCFF